MEKIHLLNFDLEKKLKKLKAKGFSIAAYGASAKGTTLLNYFNIGKYIDFVVDKSVEKHNKFTPGTALKILPTDYLMIKKPAYVLLLAWNFSDEILKQQSDYIAMGGKFIIPFPRLREIS